MQTQNATAGYHFTVGIERSPDEMIELLGRHCKKWVFQKEVGEEAGLPHYQGQVSLKKKIRFDALKKNNWMPGCHWSVTHSVEDWSYAQKEDTRVEGPWTMEENTPVILTRESKEFSEQVPYPWQAKVLEMAETYDKRNIDVIFNADGNAGKSTLAKFMSETRKAVVIPPVNDASVVMQYAHAFPNKKCYMIDMPRAMRKNKLHDLYTAIEMLKGGYMCETRYSAQALWMDNPRIVVFTNTIPNLDYVSRDRWRIWDISEDKDLVPHDMGGL